MGFIPAPAETVEVYDSATNSWSVWQPASLVDEALLMIDSWVVDDIGTVLGEFVPRTGRDVLDGVLPKLDFMTQFKTCGRCSPSPSTPGSTYCCQIEG